MNMLVVDEEPLSAPAAVRAPERCSILVVEDDGAFGDLLETTLRSRGYEVLRASTVPEARAQLAAAGPVDLVLADLRLPRELGHRLLYARELLWDNTPVLVMTAFPSEHLRDFLASQRVPLLEKPFSMETLFTVVRALVEDEDDPRADETFPPAGSA